jgi:cell division protein FtsA
MQKFFTGIDIGTYHVKVVIAAPGVSPDVPMQVLGTGTSSSRGLRHGYIVDIKEASASIREAVTRASQAAKVKVTKARVALGGVGLDEVRSTGDVTLTTSGGLVTERDMERAAKESEKRAVGKLVNRTVIHAIPLEYRVDGNKVFGKPEGLQGAKLSVDTLLITMLAKHHDDILDAVELAGIEAEGVMASPIAASFVTLTKAQKTAGVALANIGSETLTIIVYDNDIPISVKVFPIGAASITEKIALDFQLSLPEAEQAKRGAVMSGDVSSKKIQTIVNGRLKDMFTLVNSHLKTINRQRLLPAGLVITGGGSGITNAIEVARVVLKLPSSISSVGALARTATVDATWAVSYGLCRWAYAESLNDTGHSFADVLKESLDSLRGIFKSLLP